MANPRIPCARFVGVNSSTKRFSELCENRARLGSGFLGSCQDRDSSVETALGTIERHDPAGVVGRRKCQLSKRRQKIVLFLCALLHRVPRLLYSGLSGASTGSSRHKNKLLSLGTGSNVFGRYQSIKLPHTLGGVTPPSGKPGVGVFRFGSHYEMQGYGVRTPTTYSLGPPAMKCRQPGLFR